MAELDYGLLAGLKKITKKFFIDTNKQVLNYYFEDFINYVIASNLLEIEFEEYAKI